MVSLEAMINLSHLARRYIHKLGTRRLGSVKRDNQEQEEGTSSGGWVCDSSLPKPGIQG